MEFSPLISPNNHNEQQHKNIMTFYKTFKRSCTNWSSFASARKITEETGLTYEQASQRCQEFNNNRTPAQIRKGTKLEFTAQ